MDAKLLPNYFSVNVFVLAVIFRRQISKKLTIFPGFIDFMLQDESLINYANLFSHNDYEKKDKIILKYFYFND